MQNKHQSKRQFPSTFRIPSVPFVIYTAKSVRREWWKEKNCVDSLWCFAPRTPCHSRVEGKCKWKIVSLNVNLTFFTHWKAKNFPRDFSFHHHRQLLSSSFFPPPKVSRLPHIARCCCVYSIRITIDIMLIRWLEMKNFKKKTFRANTWKSLTMEFGKLKSFKLLHEELVLDATAFKLL